MLFSLIALGRRHLAAILRLLNRQMSVLFFQLENIPQNLVYSKSAMQRLNILSSFSPLEIAISESSGCAPAAQDGIGIRRRSLCVLSKSKRPKVNLTEFPADLLQSFVLNAIVKDIAVHCCGALISNCFIKLSRCWFMIFFIFGKWTVKTNCAAEANSHDSSALGAYCHTLAAKITSVLVEMCCPQTYIPTE